MQKIIIFFTLLMQTAVSFSLPAHPDYQIDVIIFARTSEPLSPLNPAIIPKVPEAKSFAKSGDYYSLLPYAASHLASEYYALRKQSEFQILAHYSWKQPQIGKQKIFIKTPVVNGWQMEGFISLARNQYYVLDTQVLISDTDQKGFLFSKKEKLKANKLYYLDHQGAGMLIRIHV